MHLFDLRCNAELEDALSVLAPPERKCHIDDSYTDLTSRYRTMSREGFDSDRRKPAVTDSRMIRPRLALSMTV